jgi:hypothetical protein
MNSNPNSSPDEVVFIKSLAKEIRRSNVTPENCKNYSPLDLVLRQNETSHILEPFFK